MDDPNQHRRVKMTVKTNIQNVDNIGIRNPNDVETALNVIDSQSSLEDEE